MHCLTKYLKEWIKTKEALMVCHLIDLNDTFSFGFCMDLGIFEGLMGQILAKEVLYEPFKEIDQMVWTMDGIGKQLKITFLLLVSKVP